MLPDLSILALSLAGIGITVYTFAVSLLGDAIQESHKKEDEIQKNRANDFELKVADLQNKVSELKESGDSTAVEAKLKEIKQARTKFDRGIKRVRSKYASLQFIPSIVLPGISLLAAYIFSLIYQASLLPSIFGVLAWGISLLCIAYGTFRILRSLAVMQEINLNTDSQKTRMKQAFQEALAEHDRETQEQLSISFPNHSFPLTQPPETELKLKFRVNLESGRAAHVTEVWFFIPDEFEIIAPTEFFRQAEDFVVPNIRTVRILVGTITRGTYNPGSITLNTPKLAGTYFILCRTKSEENTTERLSLEINIAP